jgi:hypothetical protein
LAENLGLLTSEGDSSSEAMRFGNSDRDVLARFSRNMTQLFGGDWSYSYDGQMKDGRLYPYGVVRTAGGAARLISALGMTGLSQAKNVPSIIFRSPREVVAAYLRGLFEGDGGMTAARDNDQYLALVTTSEDIGRQTHQLLLGLGLCSTLWSGFYTYKGERRRQWRVKLFGADIVAYAEQVGFISTRKQQQLASLVEAIQARGDRTGLRTKNDRDGDLQWFKITSITEGMADCYDISVPGPECFLANGIVCHNSASSIARISKHVAAAHHPKRTDVYEVTATAAANWTKAEVFKSAINLDRVHAPMLDIDGTVNEPSARAELEMRFLQRKNKRVDHPSSGPIQSKDVADAMIEVVWKLIGREVAEEIGMQLGALGIGTSLGGGANPYGSMTNHQSGKNDIGEVADQFRRSGRGSPSQGGFSPARGPGGMRGR